MKIQFIDRESGKILTEKPPAEQLLKFLYNNPFGKVGFLSLAKRKMLSQWYGRKMNQESSKNKIQEFVQQHQINMSESLKPTEDFAHFNDFFYRKLKPNARPIQEGFVSPGDGKLLVFERLNELQEFFVKGSRFNLNSFIQDKNLATEFANASLLILRLAPNDYHRFHFPANGTPSELKTINGHYYSVSPYALQQNFAKVFLQNKRAYCLLDTQTNGKVLIAAVGATMVGSIVPTYTANTKIQKGQEMGYFAFGGSTIVLLVNNLKIDGDLIENTKKRLETAVKMGEKIGF